MTARVGFADEKLEMTGKVERLTHEIVDVIEQITQVDPTYSDELAHVMKFNLGTPGQFADKIAAAFHLPLDSKQEILEAFQIDSRLKKLMDFLKIELERAAISYEIKRNVEEKNAERTAQILPPTTAVRNKTTARRRISGRQNRPAVEKRSQKK